MKCAALIALVCAGSVHAAQTIHVLVAIGNNVGDVDDVPLHYAHADAERVARLFQEIGSVSPENTTVLLEQPATVVRARLARVAQNVASLVSSGTDVVFILYVSAHARAGQLHLTGSHVPIAELKALAGATSARLRLMVVDACDSGAVTQNKGATAGSAYDITLEQHPVSGQVVMTSSGPAEASQEWASLGGSLFTHHWLTGLRGDADLEGDGKVTLLEAYTYAYRRTVANAVITAQHPLFDIDLVGAGDIVLAEPAIAKSVVVFPEALEGRYLLASQPRADIVAEVEKTSGRAVHLAVPPGRYVLRKPLGTQVGLLTLDLPYGGSVAVDERAMVKRAFTEVAVKGGFVELNPSAVLLVSTLQNEPLLAAGARVRLGAAYRHTWGSLWALSSITVGRAGFRAGSTTVHETSGTLGIAAGHRWLLTPVMPFVGLTGELVSIWQTLTRDDEADIVRVVGARASQPRNSWGGSAGIVAGLEVPLPSRFFILVSGQLMARAMPAVDQPLWSLGVQGFVAAGARF